MSFSRLLLLALVSVCLAGLGPAVARGDGDPASDFLIVQDVFFPYEVKLPPGKAEHLTSLVNAANAGGYRVKVALIATPYDLGAVTPLWSRPQRYARFLGQELFYVYKGRLLIVMPNGYGIYNHGKPIAAERRLLDRLPTPAATGADVATAGATGLRRLARASGVKLAAAPAAARTADGPNYALIAIAAAVGGAWVLLAAFLLLRRRRLASARDESSREGPG